MAHCNRTLGRQQGQKNRFESRINSDHFFNLLTDDMLLDVVEEHLPKHRERQYPPTMTLAMFLGQVMNADGSCQRAVNEANVSRVLSGLTANSARTGGYCRARHRLPTAMVKALTRKSGLLLCQQLPKTWLWRGRHVKLVDGTTVLLPDTPDNQRHYPQHGRQTAGVGLPIARMVGVLSLATGAAIDTALCAYKGKGTSEHALLRQLLESFEAGDIMLADSYYCSYFLIADLQARGVDVVLEQHGVRKTDFRCGKRLGARDHIVSWRKPPRPFWMEEEDYQSYADTLSMREVKSGKKTLVTTLHAHRTIPKKALADLYWQRWHVELDLRNLKTTLDLEMLSCKTASMCEKELWVYMLAHNLIRLLMAQAAFQSGCLPRELSFKHTLQMWTEWSRQHRWTNANTSDLFDLISQIRVGKRPGRIEPRAVKKRPKPYIRLMKPREQERERIKRQGHEKKLAA